jgi:hypothetical protein
MPDLDHISEILEAVRDAWIAHPEMRLTQLIESAAAAYDYTIEPFFLEDKHMLEGLKQLAAHKA